MLNNVALLVDSMREYELLMLSPGFPCFAVVIVQCPGERVFPIKTPDRAFSVKFYNSIDTAAADISGLKAVIASRDSESISNLALMCRELQIQFTHYDIEYRKSYTSKLLKALGITSAKDSSDNTFTFASKKDAYVSVSFTAKCKKSSVCINGDITVIESLGISVNGSNASVNIGKGNVVTSMNITADENALITITDDSIFSKNISMRASFTEKITINRHCYIGSNSLILGNAYLHMEVVAKQDSLIMYPYFKGVVIKGRPAGIYETGIIWTRSPEGADNVTYTFSDCDYNIGIIPDNPKFVPFSAKHEHNFPESRQAIKQWAEANPITDIINEVKNDFVLIDEMNDIVKDSDLNEILKTDEVDMTMKDAAFEEGEVK